LTRATAILAAAFMTTSILLVVMHNRERAPRSILEQSAPALPAVPAVPPPAPPAAPAQPGAPPARAAGPSQLVSFLLTRASNAVNWNSMTRFIFITGGVVSSLGKGLSAAALGALLQARGFKVRLRKLDPYLNVDPGTMSPYQHGEVYVTDDGAETDLDLGH